MENQEQFRIFIVDDDIFCSKVYEQYLRDMQFSDVSCFNNGNDCLDQLHTNPEIIFLDHQMDDLNGFEVLKKIKRFNPNIYVVMISGQENIQTAVDALKYGAFDYIIKDGEVSARIQTVIQRILRVKDELSKMNPGLFRRFLSLF